MFTPARDHYAILNCSSRVRHTVFAVETWSRGRRLYWQGSATRSGLGEHHVASVTRAGTDLAGWLRRRGLP